MHGLYTELKRGLCFFLPNLTKHIVALFVKRKKMHFEGRVGDCLKRELIFKTVLKSFLVHLYLLLLSILSKY